MSDTLFFSALAFWENLLECMQLFCLFYRQTSKDEMCNLYIMYYMDSKHAKPYMYCMQEGNPELFKHIPPEANIPIPFSPNMAMHGHHAGN